MKKVLVIFFLLIWNSSAFSGYFAMLCEEQTSHHAKKSCHASTEQAKQHSDPCKNHQCCKLFPDNTQNGSQPTLAISFNIQEELFSHFFSHQAMPYRAKELNIEFLKPPPQGHLSQTLYLRQQQFLL